MKTRFGERASCKYCGQEIEFSCGPKNWTDRGGNRACCAFVDRKLGEIVRPKTKHAPYQRYR